MSNSNNINAATPFLIGMPNSRINPVWIRLFLNLIGASGGSSTDDLQAYVYAARVPSSISNTVQDLQSAQLLVTALKGQVSDLMRRINDLEAMMPQPKSKSSSDSIAVMDDVATNLTMYPLWSDGINGNRRPRVSSTQWTFNPSTGKMSASILSSTGSVTAQSGTALPAGGSAGAGFLLSSVANFGVFFGSGAPTLSAAQGSLYLRSDGTTTNNRMYVNTNGSTTWTAVTTVA